MGQRKNWKLFVETTKAKAEAHDRVAQHWNKIHQYLGLVLILISAITTVLAAIDNVPKMVTVAVSGVTTLISAIAGFLKPSDRQQIQTKSAKEFRSLSMKMIRCETDHKYEQLWQDYNRELFKEPFLPKKYRVKVDALYSMSPELEKIIADKEESLGLPAESTEEAIDISPEPSAEVEENERRGCCW